MPTPLHSILAEKGWDVITVLDTDPLPRVCETLARHGIGGAPVLDGAGRLVGLVSERKIVEAVSLSPAGLGALVARDVMAANTPIATPDEDSLTTARRMTRTHCRHMPVVDNGRLVGLVSIGDLVKYRIEDAEHLAEDLQNYVSNSGHASVKVSGM
ncbi:CBS domain-containing protein [Acetobacter sacchari]|uniref:CBS domain-containing protein n=1 Tax=Acetobacter sacchari TaxID=2661687 RepID=A0ABS3M123_9PROT|nr:CBS domain-containing protein [Acetobacter sacchari]MBO1361820.1 CBS domain-containing protein [Acetobacter sacchari]